jgi:hypothetical protein
MPNKTVTIHPAVEVPEGNKCFSYNTTKDELIYECRSFIGDLSGCAIWPDGELEPAEDESFVTKCQPCKDLCEKEKNKVCEACGGRGQRRIRMARPDRTVGYGYKKIPCPDCQSKESVSRETAPTGKKTV